MNRCIVIGALLALAGTLSGACASTDEDLTDDSAGAATSAPTGIYGKDRVGAVLEGHPEKIPSSFIAYEQLFGTGRSCKRLDSKEIFIIEEAQTRLAGPRELHEVSPTKLMPRAVITGCNDGDLASARKSYSLMAALISDPGQPGAASGDTIRTWPLEVMALDEETGLYNFYEFEPVNPPADGGPVPKDAPGRVTRIYRTKQTTGAGAGGFNVFERRLQAGAPVTAEKQPIGGGNRCFNCHVEGAPLMNELQNPWTHWVSVNKTVPLTQTSGLTAELVKEAVVDPVTKRSSLANDLEPIMRDAIVEYTFGKTRSNGWSRRTLSGELPGGPAKMLESVFCETEVNYASANQSLPLELWIDPTAAALGSLVPPKSLGDDLVPFQFPIRSYRDIQTEDWLLQKQFISSATALAIRLIDDENAIFSPKRCGLLADVARGAPSEPAAMEDHVRKTVASKVDSLGITRPAQLTFIKALLTPGIRREVAQRDYVAELTARYNAMAKDETDAEKKDRDRKVLLKKKFAGRSNPLPILKR